MTRYAAQHASFLASDRLYFCLEERAAACADGPLGGLGSSGASPSDPLPLLHELQQHYCGASGVSGRGLGAVRAALLQPLVVEEQSIGSHRAVCGGSACPAPWLSLAAFPDVVSARPQSGPGAGPGAGPRAEPGALHFAPACAVQLIETAALQRARLRSEGVIAVGRALPHPCLALLARTRPEGEGGDGAAPLSTLYALVRVVRGKHGAGDAEAALADGAAGQEGPVLLMLPLPPLALHELLCSLASVQPPALGVMPTAGAAPPRTPENPAQPPLPCASFADLLPDTARGRPSNALGVPPPPLPAALAPRSDKPVGGSSAQAAQAGPYRHTYALLPDEYLYTLPAAHAGAANAASSGSLVNSRSRPCYYLVQLRDDALPPTPAAVPASASASAAVPGACPPQETAAPRAAPHLDDDDDDGFLDALLQARRGLAQGGAAPSEGHRDRSEDRRWDGTILSSLCRWRSCLAEATAAGPKHLCAYHSQLLCFLEGCEGAGAKASPGGEASKYLPKRAPVLPSANALCDPQRDLRCPCPPASPLLSCLTTALVVLLLLLLCLHSPPSFAMYTHLHTPPTLTTTTTTRTHTRLPLSG